MRQEELDLLENKAYEGDIDAAKVAYKEHLKLNDDVNTWKNILIDLGLSEKEIDELKEDTTNIVVDKEETTKKENNNTSILAKWFKEYQDGLYNNESIAKLKERMSENNPFAYLILADKYCKTFYEKTKHHAQAFNALKEYENDPEFSNVQKELYYRIADDTLKAYKENPNEEYFGKTAFDLYCNFNEILKDDDKLKPEVINKIIYCYENGIGCEKNEEKALNFLKILADKGDLKALIKYCKKAVSKDEYSIDTIDFLQKITSYKDDDLSKEEKVYVAWADYVLSYIGSPSSDNRTHDIKDTTKSLSNVADIFEIIEVFDYKAKPFNEKDKDEIDIFTTSKIGQKFFDTLTDIGLKEELTIGQIYLLNFRYTCCYYAFDKDDCGLRFKVGLARKNCQILSPILRENIDEIKTALNNEDSYDVDAVVYSLCFEDYLVPTKTILADFEMLLHTSNQILNNKVLNEFLLERYIKLACSKVEVTSKDEITKYKELLLNDYWNECTEIENFTDYKEIVNQTYSFYEETLGTDEKISLLALVDKYIQLIINKDGLGILAGKVANSIEAKECVNKDETSTNLLKKYFDNEKLDTFNKLENDKKEAIENARRQQELKEEKEELKRQRIEQRDIKIKDFLIKFVSFIIFILSCSLLVPKTSNKLYYGLYVLIGALSCVLANILVRIIRREKGTIWGGLSFVVSSLFIMYLLNLLAKYGLDITYSSLIKGNDGTNLGIVLVIELIIGVTYYFNKKGNGLNVKAFIKSFIFELVILLVGFAILMALKQYFASSDLKLSYFKVSGFLDKFDYRVLTVIGIICVFMPIVELFGNCIISHPKYYFICAFILLFILAPLYNTINENGGIILIMIILIIINVLYLVNKHESVGESIQSFILLICLCAISFITYTYTIKSSSTIYGLLNVFPFNSLKALWYTKIN